MDQLKHSVLVRQATAFVLLVASAFLLIGGTWLAMLLGSLYYAIAGAAVSVLEFFVRRSNRGWRTR